MVNAIIAVLVALGLAYLLAEVLKKLGIPRVVGQISAGIVLSIPLFKNYLFTTDNLEIISFLANLGIILLFYYIGLETNFQAFTKNIKKSVLISLLNTFLPLATGFLVMFYLFDFSLLVSLLIGISLAVSAQSVSVDLLEELKMIKSKLGTLIISAGAVDDIIELLLVSILFSVFHVAVSNLTLGKLALDITLFVLVIILARLLIIPFVLRLFDRQGSSTARFTGSLLVVLIIASLAEYLGVGLFIGAMIAGMIVRQTIFKEENIPNRDEKDIANSIHISAFGFLIPIFFVWIGLNVDLSTLWKEAGFISILLLISLFGTVGGSALAVVLAKGKWRDGFILGWGLSPKGDVELVIAALALSTGIIHEDLFTALVMAALLTTIISPIVFK
ncbi:MAG: cation:proton antiporter, partial [Candidatus Woesearchaeota archaeon]